MRGRILLLLLLLPWGTAPATAQHPDRIPERLPRHNFRQMPEPWRSRLRDADRMVRLGSLGRAETLLDEAERLGAPAREVRRRRIAVATALGDLDRVIRLCREGLQESPDDIALHRALGRALLQAGRPAEAAPSLARLIRSSPNQVATAGEVARLYREAGYPDRGLAVVDSVRAARNDQHLLSRDRAACLFDLGRRRAAVDELLRDLAQNPLNFSLVASELLARVTDPAVLADTADELGRRSADGAVARLLEAVVRLHLGQGDEALAAVQPLLDGTDPVGRRLLLRVVHDLQQRFDSLADPGRRRAAATWMLAVLDELASREDPASGRRPRLLDMLAGVTEQALDAGLLDDDPERAVARLQRVLDLVREGSPGSTRLYSAQIRLALFLRDRLGRPREAAAALQRLLTDLDLPLEGVALARLTLGECRLAAGDTAAARAELTRLGRDRDFPSAAARAQYLLAQLDLAEGAWETARDRLAAVALVDPQLDVTNDALDLGLLLAEELENPAGGPDVLALYAPVVYWRLRRDPGREREALRELIARRASVPAAGDHPRPVLERARFELARLDSLTGRVDEAVAQCGAIVADFPDGHYPAAALLLAGDVLAGTGRRDEALQWWQRLLDQYPDAIEAEDARERIRRTTS